MSNFDCQKCEDKGCDECGNSFHFQATWNLIVRLADQISHPSLAVAELIKNAYDADSTKVLVNMKKSMQGNPNDCEIVIHDDGHGMSKKDINTKWSNMGVSANKGNPVSPKGRARQGGFGVGRFGCWKLGQKVTMATKKKGHPIYSLVIDFSKHPIDTPLEEVMTEILEEPRWAANLFPDGTTGTYLLVEKFNNIMTSHTDIQKIQAATRTLQNPFEKDEDFEIILQLPKRFESWEDFGSEEIINQALYKFEVNIDARGQTIQGKYTDNNPYSKHFNEEKILNYKTDEILGGEKCQIKALKVWIYHFHRGHGYRKLWPRTKSGTLSKENYNKNLAGFRLYKDSVRVWPYGEPGNDWLDLDHMQLKGQASKWFSNEQIIAAARFDMIVNRGILTDKTSRYGLEQNKGAEQLKYILKELIFKMRKLVNRDYPSERPAHLGEVMIEYGIHNYNVGSNVIISPRSLGGDFTTGFRITKGKKPGWLKFDSVTGNFSGTADEVSKTNLTITVGNHLGNESSNISININKKQEPIGTDGGDEISEDGESEDGESGGDISTENISTLDVAISGFRRDIINLQQEVNSKEKIKLLMELNASIKQILIDERIDD